MKIFKKVADFFTMKVENAIIDNTTPAESYKRSATMILDEIHKLSLSAVDIKEAKDKLISSAKEHRSEQSKKEAEIRIQHKKNDGKVSPTLVKIALQHKVIADAFDSKVVENDEITNKISETVVELYSQLGEIKDLMISAELDEVSAKLGINTADGSIASTERVKVNVQDVLLRVETFKGGHSVTSSVSHIDADEYLKSVVSQ